MADRMRRSPQNVADCPDPENLACGNSGAPRTAPTVVASTEVILDGGSEATQPATGVNLATPIAELRTITGTNDNGVEWTNVYITYITETPAAELTTTISPSITTTPLVVATPPTDARPVRDSNGISKGAVAGIAVGTCIAGATIAFIAAWLLFKRRDKKLIQKTCPSGYPIYADSSPELVTVQKSAAIGSPYVQVSQTQMRTPVPVPARVPVACPSGTKDALAGILPPAANEHDISTRASSLFAQAHRHIDTYYRDVHASITPSMDTDLASFGKDVDMLELLQTCSHPTVALKHALVAFILNITGPKQDGTEQTLWPAELTSFIKSQDSDSTHLSTAQALHRRLTVHIYTLQNAVLPTNRSQSRLSDLSALSLTRQTSSAIREAAEHFSLTFFPWANPTFGDQERESDLAGIITEALETRIWLVGQTGEWGFEWEVPGKGAVVVSPSLVVREDGRGPRRVVVD